MRSLAALLALLASACGPPPPEPAQRQAGQPAPASPPIRAAPAANAVRAAPEDSPRNDPALAGLSPAQRRAYALGDRDCSQGRYAPGNHLEAYRIGCAAAHNRMESGRPQG